MILLIHRDTLKPDCEAAYRAIEEDAARFCAELNCTHSHLAMEALNGTRQVWWINQFASEADKQRVADGFANNQPLMEALAGIRKRREDVIARDEEVCVEHRPHLSRGAPWSIAGARFFVAEVTNGEPLTEGSVFETDNGTRYVFNATRTLEEAENVAVTAGDRATVFAVRPYWGMPAQEWITADPEFWRLRPHAAPAPVQKRTP
jgi:hypothetical protein